MIQRTLITGGVEAVFHLIPRVGAGQRTYEIADHADVNDTRTSVSLEILSVEALVNTLLLAHQNVESLAARALNMDGGTSNTIRLIEFIRKIEILQDSKIEIQRDRWRQEDQRYFVSDTTLFRKATGWRPLVSLDHQWLFHKNLIPQTASVGYEIRSD